jgi:hypothetical protein
MGLLSRLFTKGTNDRPRPITDAEAVKIIRAYGKAIVDRNSAFADLSALPYPKSRIKQALIHGIRTTDDRSFREQLKAAYVTLSEWQPGLGNRAAAGEFTEEELRDPAKAMKRALQDDFLKVPEAVAAEANALLAELKTLGLA